jgi:hypothetical protein
VTRGVVDQTRKTRCSGWRSLVRCQRDMHLLATVLIPFGAAAAAIRPLAARDAALWARLDMLLFRYQQPDEDWAWGVDPTRGFAFDWWELAGRANGWGHDIRTLMSRQRLRPSRRPIPRFLRDNAVWSEDLRGVRLSASAYPVAVLTPHGDWVECSATVMNSFGKMTVRERKAKVAWLNKIRRLMHAYPRCLAIAVDYHC